MMRIIRYVYDAKVIGIAAQEKVELLAPAKVEGTIDSPVFLLEEGVLVNGVLKMSSMNPTPQ